MFAEITGIIALTAVFAYGIYVLFFAKQKDDLTVTVNGDWTTFRRGDIVTISNVKYNIQKVEGQTLKMKSSRPSIWENIVDIFSSDFHGCCDHDHHDHD